MSEPLTDDELTDDELTALISIHRLRRIGGMRAWLFDDDGRCVFGCGAQVGGGHKSGCTLLRLVAEVRRLRSLLSYHHNRSGDWPKCATCEEHAALAEVLATDPGKA